MYHGMEKDTQACGSASATSNLPPTLFGLAWLVCMHVRTDRVHLLCGCPGAVGFELLMEVSDTAISMEKGRTA